MSDVYLRENRPDRSQYRSPRRAKPTGLVVLHTAESVLDYIGPDTGAENVAAFIRRRNTPGSYHDIVDSDSNIQLVRYDDEAYQDGTGSNPFALSISFALKATDWPRLSDERREAFLRQGVKAFLRQQAWLREHGYPTTQLRRVNKAQSDRGEAGFIPHADRDPSRRTDPGRDFPWNEWFLLLLAASQSPAPPVTTRGPSMVIVKNPAGNDQYLAHMGMKWKIRTMTELRAYEQACPRVELDVEAFARLEEKL